MPVRHVLKVNGYGGRQAKGNEKRQCFKGWETLVIYLEIYKYLCPTKPMTSINNNVIYRDATCRLERI